MGAYVSAIMDVSPDAFRNAVQVYDGAAQVQEGAVQLDAKVEKEAVTVEKGAMGIDAKVEKGAVMVEKGAVGIDAKVEKDAVTIDAKVEKGAVPLDARVEKDAVKVYTDVKNQLHLKIGDSLVAPLIFALVAFVACIQRVVFVVALLLLTLAVSNRHKFPLILEAFAPSTQPKHSVPPMEFILQSSILNKNVSKKKMAELLNDLRKAETPEKTADIMNDLISLCTKSTSHCKDKQGILVMGMTGAGKSTFIDLLKGCKLVEERKNNRKFVKVSKNSKVSEVCAIGHHCDSFTLLPKPIPLNDSVMIVDTPGFGDNRGGEINIVNTINTLDITTRMKQVTLVLVIEFHCVNDTRFGGKFKELVKGMIAFLPEDNISQYAQSVLLFVNRVKPGAELRYTRNQIRSYKHKQEECVHNFLGQLADNTFYYDPLRTQTHGDFLGQLDIIQRVLSTEAIHDTRDVFSPYLNNDDFHCVQGIAKGIEDSILALCKKHNTLEGDDAYQVHCKCEVMSKLLLLKHGRVEKMVKIARDSIVGHYRGLLAEAVSTCAALDGKNDLKKALNLVQAVEGSCRNLRNGNNEHSTFEWLDDLNQPLSGAKNRIEFQRNNQLPPEAPQSNADTSQTTDISARVSWKAPLSYTDIQNYTISLSGKVRKDELTGTTKSYVLENLLPGESYLVQIRATNKVGPGKWSDVVQIHTTATFPAPVQELQFIARDDDKLKISWRAPMHQRNATPVTSYKVIVDGKEYCNNHDHCHGSGEQALVIDRLKADTWYDVSVFSENLAGFSAECRKISTSTTNVLVEDLKAKTKSRTELQAKPETLREVYSEYYYKNDSDIFSCAKFSGGFACDYKIARVDGPSRCWTFRRYIKETGASWEGNSATDGIVDGNVKVFAKNKDFNRKKIKDLDKTILELEKKVKTMEYISRFG